MSPPGPHDSSISPQLSDTICGIATPLGRGGIGVIRISGPRTFPLVAQVFHGKHRPEESRSHTILYGSFVDPTTGNQIDEVLLSVFKKPNSYTGEDVAELSFHGSPVILGRALAILTGLGLRQARPGEFTMRAFCNGRIDLTQAEAVAELVKAKTSKATEAALRQLEGSLKGLVSRLRSDLIEALAWLEMSADFIEEDIEFKKTEEISARINAIIDQLVTLENSYQRSHIARHGLTITIVGAPNVGKSSIFNRLLTRERSIVTTIPGTTRDTIDDCITVEGYPVRLVDTAGIRKTNDTVEAVGIDRTIALLKDSDLVFWVLDGSVGFVEEDREISRLVAGRPVAVLVNKSDIAHRELIDECRLSANIADCFVVSAETGAGVDKLIQWVAHNHLDFASDHADFTFLVNQRHLDAIGKAKEHLRLAGKALAAGESHEFSAFDVRHAVDILGEIIGVATPDDVLNKVFADFCVGK